MNIECLERLYWAHCMCSINFNNYLNFLIFLLPSTEVFLNILHDIKKTFCNFTSDYFPSFITCFFFICILFFDQNEAQIIL